MSKQQNHNSNQQHKQSLQNILHLLSIEELKNNSISKFEKNGFLFKGFQTKTGRLNGRGTILEKNKIVYEGSMKNNKFHGRGKKYTYFPKKTIYDGNFKNRKFEGTGTLMETPSLHRATVIKRYEGSWKNGYYNGFGCLYNQKGEKEYEGNFKNGKKNGQGQLFENGKLLYQGTWKDDKISPKKVPKLRNISSLSHNIEYYVQQQFSNTCLLDSGLKELKKIVLAIVSTFCENMEHDIIFDTRNFDKTIEKIYPIDLQEYAFENAFNGYMKKNNTIIKDGVVLEMIKKFKTLHPKDEKDRRVKYITGIIEYTLTELIGVLDVYIINKKVIEEINDNEIRQLLENLKVDHIPKSLVNQEYIPK
jgi:hypothetical protein